MGKSAATPIGYYANFARWNRLTLMRAPGDLRELREVARTAEHPERLQKLIELIEDELGYRALSRRLGRQGGAVVGGSTALSLPAQGIRDRADDRPRRFEAWIAEDLAPHRRHGGRGAGRGRRCTLRRSTGSS